MSQDLIGFFQNVFPVDSVEEGSWIALVSAAPSNQDIYIYIYTYI